MNACLSTVRNLEESMGRNLYRFSIESSITFHLKKKKKKEMWKGRLNGKNSKLHILLQASNQTRGSGSVTPSTKRDQVMFFVCTLVNKFEGLDFS